MKSNPPSPEPSANGPTAPIPHVEVVPVDAPDLSMTAEEWAARQEIEKRFAHAHRRRFGLNNTVEDRRHRDQLAFLASFIVIETVRHMDATDPNEV